MKRIAIIIKGKDTSWQTLRQLFLTAKYGVNILRLGNYEPHDFNLN